MSTHADSYEKERQKIVSSLIHFWYEKYFPTDISNLICQFFLLFETQWCSKIFTSNSIKLSENGRKCTVKGGEWSTIRCEDPLPNGRVNIFEMHVERIRDNCYFFGILPSHEKKSEIFKRGKSGGEPVPFYKAHFRAYGVGDYADQFYNGGTHEKTVGWTKKLIKGTAVLRFYVDTRGERDKKAWTMQLEIDSVKCDYIWTLPVEIDQWFIGCSLINTDAAALLKFQC